MRHRLLAIVLPVILTSAPSRRHRLDSRPRIRMPLCGARARL
jgi:hypothetical protein